MVPYALNDVYFNNWKIETVLTENAFTKVLYMFLLWYLKKKKLQVQVPCCSSFINSENGKEWTGKTLFKKKKKSPEFEL